jgi:hypothetical protein
MRHSIATLRNALTRWRGRAGLKWRSWQAEKRFPEAAAALLTGFLDEPPPTRHAYADLFRYFLTGFMVHRSPLGAHADYAGMGSYNGPAMDRLEGFSRFAPLAAAWLHGGHDSQVMLADGTRVDLPEMLKSGMLAGTDPASREYWGDIHHWGQAIVEAADIALVLWLGRTQLWDPLSPGERDQIGRWLIQVNGKRIPDNNWHLFVVQVNAVLASLGAPHDRAESDRHYARARAFYRGEGWFRDGEQADSPGFDYYNAWGFHYHLQWLRRIDPERDADFIDRAFREFVATYRYFIGPAGVPMLGRSACYRLAAPVPLIFAQQAHPEQISPGEARRALDAVWQYFIRHGSVKHGNVTQGYFGPDPRLLEDYSGPASCLWSLRSLVAAFALPDDHAFWLGKPEPLPVERADYRVPVQVPGWTLMGNHASGRIGIETGHRDDPPLEAYTLRDRLAGVFSKQPHRPKNIQAKYHRACYESTSPYGLSDATPQ